MHDSLLLNLCVYNNGGSGTLIIIILVVVACLSHALCCEGYTL